MTEREIQVEPGEIKVTDNGDVLIGAPTATATGSAPPPGNRSGGLIVICPPDTALPHYIVLEFGGEPVIYHRAEE